VAKGKANIKFKDGCIDGEFIKNFNTRFMRSEIIQATGLWFREDGAGIQILKDGNLDKKWHSYEVHIYKKAKKDQEDYFVYEFDRSEIIDRCTALTESGKRCMKSCYKNLSVCETHKPRRKQV